jgi:hypothetical protein
MNMKQMEIIEAGIISFKNLKSGFYLLILKRKKKVNVYKGSDHE